MLGPDHRCAPSRLHQVADLVAGTYAVTLIGLALVRWLCWAQLRRDAERTGAAYAEAMRKTSLTLRGLDADHDELACVKACCYGPARLLATR